MFGIFGRAQAKQPPFTESCRWLSAPANLLKKANEWAADPSLEGSAMGPLFLTLVIMGAAGKFDLRGQRYFRDTNLDVITAEAIVWIHFLITRLHNADPEKDHVERLADQEQDSVEQFGETALFRIARRDLLGSIKRSTGVDFTAEANGRRAIYREAFDRGEVSEPFASIVLGSVERQSLADPLKKFDFEPLPEWVQLCAQVGIFASTIPPGYYESFKRGVGPLMEAARYAGH